MAVQKLKNTVIRNATYEGDGLGRHLIWDTLVKGLGLRVYPPKGQPPQSRKAFVVSYRFKGLKKLMTLGDYGVLTVDAARIQARKILAQVEDGKDPLDERKRAARGKTLRHLITAYIEDYAKPRKKTWKADERRLNRNIPASWRSRRADVIRRADVAELHAKIGRDRPYEANRLLEILRVVFKQAKVWDYMDERALNPAEGIKRHPERKRSRYLKPQELPALAQAIDREDNVYVRAGLWLYLLTGLRKSELLEARWSDLDLEQRLLRLPETKTGGAQWATLSAPAMAILQGTPRMEGNPFILPGAVDRQHLVNIDKPWGRVRRAATVALWGEDADSAVSSLIHELRDRLRREPSYAEYVIEARKRGLDLPTGLMDVRLHDLRRTVGSWMTQAKVDLNTIRDALRHAAISTTLTYARLGDDPAREAFEAHGQRVLERAGKLRIVDGEER